MVIMQALSCVTYHCKTPTFHDEFKIELPVAVRPTHHLLFTFYNVSCKQVLYLVLINL